MNTKLKISQIRDIIRAAAWNRNDFAGHTREEFVRAPVARILNEKIAELTALEIPARFERDIVNRDWEISACKTVIARWQERVKEYVAAARNGERANPDTLARATAYIAEMGAA